MIKNIRPEMTAIQKRFFDALDLLINTKQTTLQSFCRDNKLNRIKYTNIRTELRKPDQAKPTNYKVIDIDALMYLCRDFNISPDWLLLNKGGMFRK